MALAARQHEGALHDGDARVAQRRAAHLVASIAPSRLCVLAKLRHCAARQPGGDARQARGQLFAVPVDRRAQRAPLDEKNATRFTLVTHAASAVLCARMSTSTAAIGNGAAGESAP